MGVRSQQAKRPAPRRPWRRDPTEPSIFSTASSFFAPVGRHIEPGEVRGYYIDFSFKATSADWPPTWLDSKIPWVAVAQWGLGCYELYLSGEGKRWLAAAFAAGEHLAARQQVAGPQAGGWVHGYRFKHTFDLSPPWLSAMAQGEGASLLTRLHRESGDEQYADAARRALAPMGRASADGGVAAKLAGGFFPEEYPTTTPSCVLNGGIFALWGCYDVGVGLGEARALKLFEEGAATLGASIHRYDTGYWSRYDLYPHPVPNVASGAYHQLHINQLLAMSSIYRDERLDAMTSRFIGYRDSRVNNARAFAAKATFRLLVPRNRFLAHRVPWKRRSAA